MLLYSLLITLAIILSAPWWITRTLTTERYREGLRQRLGFVPSRLMESVQGRRVLWVHAVSVGEVLAASRLVVELEAALGPGYCIVISTTTRTGQALAQQRFGADRVFYYSLDFAFAVRRYLRALKPAALVLMESELWPRMLHECQRSKIPVAVANSRLSDRSFARAMKVRTLWGRVLRKPTLWLTQSKEDARRLIAVGANAAAVNVTGNLKYDVLAPKRTAMLERLTLLVAGRRLVVGGSLLEGEEEALLSRWEAVRAHAPESLLLLAPRHPDRFETVAALAASRAETFRASELLKSAQATLPEGAVVLLDTIGDLAAVYGIATVAFVGGSLVPRAGHNPLEPAQFGVPTIMGSSFENFRDIVARLQTADGLRIVPDADVLRDTLIDLLTHPDEARALGQRGREVFEAQQGATARAVSKIIAMVNG